MEKQNGKIAIAIVAMFVVALSIVGVTYAYFVANVKSNTEDNNVQVQAGVLKISYDNGDVLAAEGIVPGWMSDNRKVYNSVASVSTVEVDGVPETHITAVNVDELTEDELKGTTTEPVGPVTFTVTDQSTKGETAYYGIRLVNVNNGLATGEKDDFVVTLTTTDATNESNTGVFASKTALVEGTGLATDVQPISGVIAITTAEGEEPTVHTYTLNAEYVETGAKQTSTGASVSATVEVVGLQLVDGVYKTATGETWTGLTA